ncbi:MAG: hypothetical protein ACOX9R_02685 [Armatimonadota bacterium]|jgi:hypothetical protein
MPEAAAPEIWGISTEIIGVWLAAFLTLAIFSFLYEDNPIYKFAEHLFVGVSAGYGVVITWHEAVIPLLIDPLFRPERVDMAAPSYLVIIPGVLGLMMFSRFFPRYDWLSRWPIAFVMGLYSGLTIPASVQADLLPQLYATMLPIWPGVEVPLWTAISNFLLIVGLLCTLAYFYFSRAQSGAFGVASKVGILFLMVAFGASFGNTVMARVSLLIGRVQFLYDDWWTPLVAEPILRWLGG